MFSRRILLVLSLVTFTSLAGCLRVGEPLPDERRQLEQWSAAVSADDRLAVQREANQHTDWMERKKTQWMIGEYRSRYAKARTREARRAAATQRAATMRAATMQSSTSPATQP